MKQKNVILMVVAVGCGLVAALLTSQMSAKPKTETVDVIVAQKDLPVGTMLTKEELPKLIKTRKMPKDALPPEGAFVLNEEDMINKRLGRAVRMDETFNPKDLKVGGTVTLPKGMDMMSVAVGLPEAVAGFVTPGSKVDILATAKAGNRQIAFPLLVDMLVLAVDAATELPEKSASFTALNTVSLAVDRKQALLLQLARTRGCQLSLVLRNTEKEKDPKEPWTTDNVLSLLQNPEGNHSDIAPGNPTNLEDGPGGKTKKAKADTVMLPIAKEEIAAGTALTADLIKEKFEVKEFQAPAPANAVLNLEEMQGKILQHPLASEQWLSRTFLGDFGPGKDSPKDAFEPEKKDGPDDAPKFGIPGRKTHDVVVTTGSGHKIFRFEQKSAGSHEWVLVGEVTKAGEAASSPPSATVDPEPKPEPKPEPTPTRMD